MPLWEMITISCTCGLGGGMIGGLIVAAIACFPRKRRKEPEKNPQNEGETPKKKRKSGKRSGGSEGTSVCQKAGSASERFD